MSTDPKHNLPSMNELPKEAQKQLESLVEHGLGNLNLRQILATALKALNEAERNVVSFSIRAMTTKPTDSTTAP